MRRAQANSVTLRAWRLPTPAGPPGSRAAQPLHLAHDRVPRPKEAWRVHEHPHAVRRPGEDDVSRVEGGTGRDELDQGSHGEDHLLGRRVLTRLAVHLGTDPQPLRVRHLVGRGDPGPQGAEGVLALAAEEVPLPPLPVPRGHVVRHAVAEHRVQRIRLPGPARGSPDDHSELRLVVGPLRELPVDDDGVSGAVQRARVLREHHGELRGLGVLLADVIHVVEPDHHHLAGPGVGALEVGVSADRRPAAGLDGVADLTGLLDHVRQRPGLEADGRERHPAVLGVLNRELGPPVPPDPRDSHRSLRLPYRSAPSGGITGRSRYDPLDPPP